MQRQTVTTPRTSNALPRIGHFGGPALAPRPAPKFVRLPEASFIYGDSRSGFYRKAPQHPGLLVKNGRTTLVCCEVADAIYGNLPPARIAAPPPAA